MLNQVQLPELPPEIIMIVGPGVLFVIVLEMVRRGRLREDYSLLWLATFGLLVLLAVFRDMLLEPISDILGIHYPPTALFVIGFGLMLVILLQFSTVITKLSKQNKQAAQHIALLGMRIRELEQQLNSEVQARNASS
jgi:hypothetical protein